MSLDAINPFLYGYYPPHSSNDQKRAKKLHHALKKTDPALSQLFYQALSLSTKRQLEQICWQLTKETIPRSAKGFSDQLQEFCETPYTIFLQILLQSLDIAKAQHTA